MISFQVLGDDAPIFVISSSRPLAPQKPAQGADPAQCWFLLISIDRCRQRAHLIRRGSVLAFVCDDFDEVSNHRGILFYAVAALDGPDPTAVSDYLDTTPLFQNCLPFLSAVVPAV